MVILSDILVACNPMHSRCMATPSDVILVAWRSCLISFWLHDNPMHEEITSLCNVKIEHVFYDNTLGLNATKILTTIMTTDHCWLPLQ